MICFELYVIKRLHNKYIIIITLIEPKWINLHLAAICFTLAPAQLGDDSNQAVIGGTFPYIKYFCINNLNTA